MMYLNAYLAEEEVDDEGGGPGQHGSRVQAGLGHETAALVAQQTSQDHLVLQLED
jgi:hypothetical protein